jgi:hypothetical protein
MLGETSKIDFNKIEMDLERTILMENVVLAIPLPKPKNANEDGESHAHINGGDIAIEFHLLQLLPHHPFKWRGWVGFFLTNL